MIESCQVEANYQSKSKIILSIVSGGGGQDSNFYGWGRDAEQIITLGYLVQGVLLW